MRADELKLCCGAMVLSDFGHTRTTGGQARPESLVGWDHATQRNIYKDTSPSREAIKDWVNGALDEYKGMAVFIVTLNEDQNVAIGDVFKEIGFKCVAKGLNSNHNSHIYLYTLCDTTYHEEDDSWADDDYYDEEE